LRMKEEERGAESSHLISHTDVRMSDGGRNVSWNPGRGKEGKVVENKSSERKTPRRGEWRSYKRIRRPGKQGRKLSS